jgi:hypothetical protein
VNRISDAMRATRHGWDAIKSKVLEDWRPADAHSASASRKPTPK